MRKWSLSDSAWKFRAADEQEWLPARVPGCVHADLRRCGKIPDPFYGRNELDLQWIDKRDWVYETKFDLPEELAGESQLALVFDGLDTYADVELNGVHVLAADNMFRVWRVGVRDIVRPQGNRLRVTFRSPIREGLARLEALGYALPAANDHSEDGGLGERKVSVFARKAPYHYGWDWGPRFVTSGIWKDVRLEGWTGLRIADLFIRQEEVTASYARISAVVELEAEKAQRGVLRVTTDGGEAEVEMELAAGTRTVEVPLSIPQPKLWWPRGLGEAHLYGFRAEWRPAPASGEASSSAAASAQVRTGLRSVKLVRRPDEAGTTFYFEINGVPVFAKGANHIPNDSFVTEVTAERYRHEIASAAASHFNMLRVWGGGVYEADVFYDLCDEYGLLVWQDFMFACSLYPGDDAFLANVRAEAADTVRRLRNHPCIVLWCGNNEIDIAWSHYVEEAGWGWKKRYDANRREQLWRDYETIFHQILPEAVDRYAPGMPYWPSSPMQALTRDERQHATNSSVHGDIHYWQVWHELAPFEAYLSHVGRFMSEYGFQSFPEEKTVRTYAEEADMALESAVMLHHQKNAGGNGRILDYMNRYLKKPRDFSAFLYMSQVLQGEAMKTAIEAHRRRKGFCMGSLYWQMNDCWPVASWASLDYEGRWKAAQYYVKRSFADVLLSIVETDGRAAFHVVTDEQAPLAGELRYRVIDFDGRLLREGKAAVRVEANAAAQVHAVPVDDLLGEADPRRAVLLAELFRDGRTGEPAAACEHYFVSGKELALDRPTIQVAEEAGGDGAAFVLTTEKLAKQVRLEAEVEGIFSDNFFDLVPGVPKRVVFRKRNQNGPIPFTPASPGKLTVSSMADYIQPD